MFSIPTYTTLGGRHFGSDVNAGRPKSVNNAHRDATPACQSMAAFNRHKFGGLLLRTSANDNEFLGAPSSCRVSISTGGQGFESNALNVRGTPTWNTSKSFTDVPTAFLCWCCKKLRLSSLQ